MRASAVPLRTLGARVPLGLRPRLLVTLAAEDSPSSTAEAVQIAGYLSNEADKLRRDTAAESDKVRRDTTEAFQGLSLKLAELTEKISQLDSRVAEKLSQLDSRVAEKISQLDSRVTGLDSTIKIVSTIAGSLGAGLLLMYFRSVYSQ